MHSRTWSLMGLALAMSACDQPRSSVKPTTVGLDEKASAEQDIARTEDSVRLSLAEKRIAELQQKIAEMEVTPQTVEIDLLKSRLEAVEAKAYAGADDLAVPRDSAAPTGARAATPTSRIGAGPATASTKRESARKPLRLPQLEPSPRPATDAEKAAFNTRPQ